MHDVHTRRILANGKYNLCRMIENYFLVTWKFVLAHTNYLGVKKYNFI